MKVDVERANAGCWERADNVVVEPGTPLADLEGKIETAKVEEWEVEKGKEEKKMMGRLRDRLSVCSGKSASGSGRDNNNGAGSATEWVIEPRSPRGVVDQQVREMSNDWRKTYGW